MSAILGIASSRPLVAAHRGFSGANIPCNTLPSFEAAFIGGADVLEMDLFLTRDGEVFVFHPGKEPRQLGLSVDVTALNAAQVRPLCYVNADGYRTSCGIERFEDVLEALRGRCLLNLDRCAAFLPEVLRAVDRLGMRGQILLKSAPEPPLLAAVQELAPDVMYMPIYTERDRATERILHMDIRFVCAELVFAREDSPVAQSDYLAQMHTRGLELWGNALVYDEAVPLVAGHTDDGSLAGAPGKGWGAAGGSRFHRDPDRLGVAGGPISGPAHQNRRAGHCNLI